MGMDHRDPRKRVMHEAFGDGDHHVSTFRLLWVLVVVIALLGGATAFMDEAPREKAASQAARR